MPGIFIKLKRTTPAGFRQFFILLAVAVVSQGVKKVKDPFVKVTLSGFAQGTAWHITYYSVDSSVLKKDIDSVLLVIDSSMSIYKNYSEIVAFNNSARGTIIGEHFKKVVRKSLDTYEQTGGFFDITVLPLVEAWGFGAKPRGDIPGPASIQALLTCVSSKNLQLKKDSLIKSNACLKIDVNGIAQGYTVDVIAHLLETKGIINYIVEIGGEIRVHGTKRPANEPFKIGIETPSDAADEWSLSEKILIIDSGAVTTSGNYRKYFESEGKKISHLMDPHTGYPVQNEMISVTVYARDAITADAYDNALMLMGLDKAMRFVEKSKDLSAFFIYHSPDGTISDTASSKFYALIQH